MRDVLTRLPLAQWQTRLRHDNNKYQGHLPTDFSQSLEDCTFGDFV